MRPWVFYRLGPGIFFLIYSLFEALSI